MSLSQEKDFPFAFRMNTTESTLLVRQNVASSGMGKADTIG